GWAVAAIVLGTVLSLRLLQMIVDPPYLGWEGQTSSGTPTGGMEVAYPALGFGFWVFGSLCFIAAGVCGLIADAQRTRDRRLRVKRCMRRPHGTEAEREDRRFSR